MAESMVQREPKTEHRTLSIVAMCREAAPTVGASKYPSSGLVMNSSIIGIAFNVVL
jgi:hypothetical protein